MTQCERCIDEQDDRYRKVGLKRSGRTAIAAIADLAAQGVGQPIGPERLGAPTTASHGPLPKLLRLLADEHPLVLVLLFEGPDDDIADWLEAGAVGLAVLVDPDRTTGTQVGQDSFHALLPRDHPIADQPVLDVRDLADDPLLYCLGGCERQVRKPSCCCWS